MQYSVAVNNARLNSIETTIGVSAVMQMRSGAKPANCAAASTGTLIAQLPLPSDWLAAAASGSKAKLGTWEDLSANNAGTLGYFRIFESTIATCHIQGTITVTGGGGDMTVNDVVVLLNQPIEVITFTISSGNI